MPPTYTSNNKIKKIANGEESGTWGATTNTNFDLYDTAIDGFATVAITGTTHSLSIPDGSAGDGRNKVISFTGSLSATNTITVTPNTVKKHYFVQNNTTGSQNIVIAQGSGSTVTVKPGYSSIVYLDGAGSGAAVKEVLTSLKLTALLEATGVVFVGSSSGTTTLQSAAAASGTLTLPAATDTLVGRATTDTLTNKSISGSTNTLSNIGNASLTNSSITINGSPVSLGGSLTIPFSISTLTIGTGLSGTSFNGTAPVTIAIDSTVATLTGIQTLTNKTLTSPILTTPNIGTPSAGTLTSCTGLPISTGVSGLGTGVATFLATPSSANLAAAVTDETGSGLLVFATSPSLTTPSLSGATLTGSLTAGGGTGTSGQFLQSTGTGVQWASATTTTSVTSKTANYTATTSDDVILCNASGGAFTITLYAASGNSGKQLTIKKTDSSNNAVTIDGNASETIDGTTTKAIAAQYTSLTIVCDGSNWHII